MVAVLVELSIAGHDPGISIGAGGGDAEGAGIVDIANQLPAAYREGARVIKGAGIGKCGPEHDVIVIGQSPAIGQRAISIKGAVIGKRAVIGKCAATVIVQRAAILIGKRDVIGQCAIIVQSARTDNVELAVNGVTAAAFNCPAIGSNDARGGLAVAIGNVDLRECDLWRNKGDQSPGKGKPAQHRGIVQLGAKMPPRWKFPHRRMSRQPGRVSCF